MSDQQLTTPPRTGEPLSVEPLGDLAAVRADWQALAKQAGNPFLTWEWAACWWEEFGEGRPLYVLGCRRPDGTLAGILPVYLASTRPLRVLRIVGHTLADRHGLVCAPADGLDVGHAFRAALATALPRWHLVVADRFAGGEDWDRRLHATIVRREVCRSLRTDGRSWETFLGGFSSKARRNLTIPGRRFVERSGGTFRLCDDPARLDDDLDALFRLHDARWGEDRNTGFSGAARSFQRRLAAAALSAGWLRLWLAEIDGRPVGAWYGWRYGNADWHYQSGRDPAYDRQAVGIALVAHSLQAAFDDGVGVYHFLLGDEPYKASLADADDGAITLAIGAGPASRGVVAGTALAQRAPRWVRRGVLRSAALLRLRV